MILNPDQRLCEPEEPGRSSSYDAALDAAQEAVTRTFGPGSSFSVDPAYSGTGFVARVWNKAGYLAYSDETARPNRLASVKDLRRASNRIHAHVILPFVSVVSKTLRTQHRFHNVLRRHGGGSDTLRSHTGLSPCDATGMRDARAGSRCHAGAGDCRSIPVGTESPSDA